MRRPFTESFAFVVVLFASIGLIVLAGAAANVRVERAHIKGCEISVRTLNGLLVCKR